MKSLGSRARDARSCLRVMCNVVLVLKMIVYLVRCRVPNQISHHGMALHGKYSVMSSFWWFFFFPGSGRVRIIDWTQTGPLATTLCCTLCSRLECKTICGNFLRRIPTRCMRCCMALYLLITKRRVNFMGYATWKLSGTLRGSLPIRLSNSMKTKTRNYDISIQLRHRRAAMVTGIPTSFPSLRWWMRKSATPTQ